MLLGFLCFILGWYAFYFIQRFTDTQVCAVAKAEDLSYDVMLSDNTDCEDVMVEENGVRVLCNTKDMTGNVTIHVCGGSFCKSLTTPLSESLTHTHTHTHTHTFTSHTHTNIIIDTLTYSPILSHPHIHTITTLSQLVYHVTEPLGASAKNETGTTPFLVYMRSDFEQILQLTMETGK